MNKKILATIVFTTIMYASKTHGMELIQISKQSSDESIYTPNKIFDKIINYFSEQALYNPVLHQQLIIPEEAFDKVIAQTSYTAHRALRITCKQLYHLASLNRLKNFLLHDFIIGNDGERKTFFKKIIETNNPDLITAILNHAKKEAPFCNLIPQDNAEYIDIDADCIAQEYVQEHYLKPLRKEARQQKNQIMLTQLQKEDPENTNLYVQEKADIKEKQFIERVSTAIVVMFALDFIVCISVAVIVPLTSNHSRSSI